MLKRLDNARIQFRFADGEELLWLDNVQVNLQETDPESEEVVVTCDGVSVKVNGWRLHKKVAAGTAGILMIRVLDSDGTEKAIAEDYGGDTVLESCNPIKSQKGCYHYRFLLTKNKPSNQEEETKNIVYILYDVGADEIPQVIECFSTKEKAEDYEKSQRHDEFDEYKIEAYELDPIEKQGE